MSVSSSRSLGAQDGVGEGDHVGAARRARCGSPACRRRPCSTASDRVLPSAKLPSRMRRWAVNTRGEASISGVLALGQQARRDQPQEERCRPQPAIAAGTMKSNMPMRRSPMSAATDTTSRLVEVPMVVAVPPISVANPIGISTADGEVPGAQRHADQHRQQQHDDGRVVDEGAQHRGHASA